MKLQETVHFKWYKHLLILIVLVLCFQASVGLTSADFAMVFANSGQMTDFLS